MSIRLPDSVVTMGLILSVLLYAAALVTAGSVVFGYVGFFVYGTIISFPVCFPVFLGAVSGDESWSGDWEVPP